MRLATASLSDRGGRPRNEDATGDWSSERLYYCVLADGAGGHGGGDTASAIVVNSVLADLRYLTVAELPPTGQRLVRAIEHANANILEEQAHGDAALKDMRSTVVLLAIDCELRTAAWAHCGDSRLYCFRGGQVSVQTRDHSLVQEMVDAHLIKPGDARHHPRRNVLLAALGTPGELDIDSFDGTFALLDRDAFLLCSDGLWEYVDETYMSEALGGAATPDAWLGALAARVRSMAPASHDNFSALAVWIADPDDMQSTVLKVS
ncbi:protein phosphatase 2C domain-containing protein [Paraburkholderia sp. C35]|uniref:PP2C family protein-serine/threonine phosphatase n=1 Tax=Paraburkholderia sp. C35 TaxID=2126993 RepID=UPI000D695370|nr:protein phosphatase 2C domain-containing protein [Paraburkholderia sp. C35]